MKVMLKKKEDFTNLPIEERPFDIPTIYFSTVGEFNVNGKHYVVYRNEKTGLWEYLHEVEKHRVNKTYEILNPNEYILLRDIADSIKEYIKENIKESEDKAMYDKSIDMEQFLLDRATNALRDMKRYMRKEDCTSFKSHILNVHAALSEYLAYINMLDELTTQKYWDKAIAENDEEIEPKWFKLFLDNDQFVSMVIAYTQENI